MGKFKSGLACSPTLGHRSNMACWFASNFCWGRPTCLNASHAGVGKSMYITWSRQRMIWSRTRQERLASGQLPMWISRCPYTNAVKSVGEGPVGWKRVYAVCPPGGMTWSVNAMYSGVWSQATPAFRMKAAMMSFELIDSVMCGDGGSPVWSNLVNLIRCVRAANVNDYVDP